MIRARYILAYALVFFSLLATRPARAAITLDTAVCPTLSTTVAGTNASTTNIQVASSATFTIGLGVQLTTPGSFHVITTIPDVTHITITPAAASAPTTGSVTVFPANCAHAHVTNGGVYSAGTATVNTTAFNCTSGTILYAIILDADHGAGTTTGAPVLAASVGGAGRYTVPWTLVVGSNATTASIASLNGGASVYRAVCGTGFTAENPRLTVTCVGGTNVCFTGTAAGNQESDVWFIGFTSVFATPGNVGVNNSAAGAPTLNLTTSTGDKLVFGWADFTGANCAQTPSTGAAVTDTYEVPGPNIVAGCNGGNDDYYQTLMTTGTTSAGTTTVGVTVGTPITGVWLGMEICDSTATSCPNAAGATITILPQRARRGSGR